MSTNRTFIIDHSPRKVSDFAALMDGETHLLLSDTAKTAIEASARYLDKKINQSSDTPIYGVNTGFGALCNTVISQDKISELQYNIIVSHACGTGDEVPAEIIRLMLALKAQSLAYGHSGVRLETVERLIDFYNQDILPVVYQYGSLGASGDLAPLAHLSLPLVGRGTIRLDGTPFAAENLSLPPLRLGPKEGLALLNGTQFMTAYGVWLLTRVKRLLQWSDIIAALSLNAFACLKQPFHFLLQKVRPHEGQSRTAAVLLRLLRGDEISNVGQVQDPYSFRCIPQIHGAVKDTYHYAEKVFTVEINSVSDNPNIFPDDDLILSGGNFHGQPLALALDFLAISLAQLGAVSERRVYHLLSGARGLPPFLSPDPGLHSGYMIAQYAAAGLVNELKHLAAPHSIDSIPSSNGQEDYVSMGANAAVKAVKVAELLQKLLGIELLHAAEALRYREPGKTGMVLRDLLSDFRTHCPPLLADRILSNDFKEAVYFLEEYSLGNIFPAE